MGHKIKSLFSMLLSFAMVISLSAPAFAISDESDPDVTSFVATTSYNPNGTLIESGQIGGDGLNSIIGDDDRSIIPLNSRSQFPYSAIGYLTLSYACGCSGEGTGFMASENCMLTAGHCIVCSEHGQEVTSITARFGHKSSSECLVEITATQDNAVIYHNPNYTGSQKNYDYGYVVFDTNVGNTTGWFGLISRSDSVLKSYSIKVLGYRFGALYTCDGSITSVTSARVKYNADTEPGESGSPVYTYFSSNDYYGVTAIHTHGTTPILETKNSGWRITTAFIDELDSLGYVEKIEF